MNTKPTAKEREHLGRVKELPCSVCHASGPSEAHHVDQRLVYTCIALCPDCHRGSFNGWHGQRRRWKQEKMEEMDALNETLRMLNG